MPDCHELQPWLVDHLQGQSGRLKEKIDRHLDDCEQCQEWVGFLQQVEIGGAGDLAGARLGFDRSLEGLSEYAAERVIPGRFQHRFIAGLVGLSAAGITLVGGILPTVRESLDWLASLGLGDLAIVGASFSIILLLSSPLLIQRARNRMEES